MKLYAGIKSLDAEIFIDLESCKISMDYSKNYLGLPTNSNTSAVLDREGWMAQPFSTRLKWVLIRSFLPSLILIPYLLYVSFSTYYFLIFKSDAKGQLDHQELIRYLTAIMNGMLEEERGGALLEKKLEFIMPNNIWVEYELKGEYQKFVKKISLTRNFMTFYRYGKFKTTQQNGWKLTFEFSELPSSGSCLVRYLK